MDAAALPDAQGVLRGFRGALQSMLRERPPGDGRTVHPVEDGLRRE
jgi:hypothetical protein